MSVFRYSDKPNDFIFKQNSDTFIGGCWVVFCGMNWEDNLSVETPLHRSADFMCYAYVINH